MRLTNPLTRRIYLGVLNYWSHAAMVGVVTLLVMGLTGCGTEFAPRGTTHAYIEGSLCGSPLKAKIADGKERSSFRARARCANGTTVEVMSADSTAFQGQEQADAMNAAILGVLDRLIDRLATPAP